MGYRSWGKVHCILQFSNAMSGIVQICVAVDICPNF